MTDLAKAEQENVDEYQELVELGVIDKIPEIVQVSSVDDLEGME